MISSGGDTIIGSSEHIPFTIQGDYIDLPKAPRLHTKEEVIEIFKLRDKKVITFLGFGELGYENEEEVTKIATQELKKHPRQDTIVNTGTLITFGFRQGIVAVYRIAKNMGFETTGIHPSVALCSNKPHGLSRYVDKAYFVNDHTWGGLVSPKNTLSPTLCTLVSITHEAVAIGGGKHTAEELKTLMAHGKPVTYYPAQMHHATSHQWTRQNGVALEDFWGEAYHCWASNRRSR